MAEQLQTILAGLEAPALAVIASEAELALRIQTALKGSQNAPESAEEGESRESCAAR